MKALPPPMVLLPEGSTLTERSPREAANCTAGPLSRHTAWPPTATAPTPGAEGGALLLRSVSSKKKTPAGKRSSSPLADARPKGYSSDSYGERRGVLCTDGDSLSFHAANSHVTKPICKTWAEEPKPPSLPCA